jgi:hypothetical protein
VTAKASHTFAKMLDVTGWQLVEFSRQLAAGNLSAEELEAVAELLTYVVDAVHLYADKLGTATDDGTTKHDQPHTGSDHLPRSS